MSRASKAELERRIEEVYDLLLSRLPAHTISGYCRKKWGVSERQVRTYVARARLRVAEAAAESHPEQMTKMIADYDMVFAKQLAGGHLAEARATLDSIVRLLGLAAPQRHEISGDQTLKVIVEYTDEGEP